MYSMMGSKALFGIIKAPILVTRALIKRFHNGSALALYV